MSCGPPYKRGSGGWCGCDCKCCPPPSCPVIKYKVTVATCSSSSSSSSSSGSSVACCDPGDVYAHLCDFVGPNCECFNCETIALTWDGSGWVGELRIDCPSSSSSSSMSDSSGSSSSQQSPQGDCCQDSMGLWIDDWPENLSATISNVSGCDCLDGVVVTLEKDITGDSPTYIFLDASGGSCNFITEFNLLCLDNVWTVEVACGADNRGDGQATNVNCNPFQIEFTIFLDFLTDITCCQGTINIVVTE